MTFIYFILILGITVFIHELGHFIFAKKAGIYCYEFSIGMGPVIKKWKRKNDETDYCLRLFPIGGYVAMAGEQIDDDDNVPAKKRLYNKSWSQRFMVIIAGVMMNFILAITIFFLLGLTQGTQSKHAYISMIEEKMPAYNSGLSVGDKITHLNGKTIDANMLQLKIMVDEGDSIDLTVEHTNGEKETIDIKPKKTDEGYKFGFGLELKRETGFLNSLIYAFRKTGSLINQMVHIIFYLITGQLAFNNLSGPVGIYEAVGVTAKAGFASLIYLLGYISLNVGFMNLLPIPAFDGGRLFFLIIEKIKGSPVSAKVENTVHAIGMFFLLGLMVIITFNDILRIFF